MTVHPPTPVPLTRPSGPAPAFDALVRALVRGDDIDAELTDAVCRSAGKSVTDLANAVRRAVAAGAEHPVVL